MFSRFLMLLLASEISLIIGLHQCDHSFGKFIQCMNGKVANELNVLKSELMPEKKERIASCFTAATCSAPQFSQATISYFVQDTIWQQRLNELLGFLEDVHPQVSKCMVDHFVMVTLNSLEDCIQRNGPVTVRDFKFPRMKIDVNFKISELQQVILNRMMVRTKLKSCMKTNEGAIPTLLTCLRSAKSFNSGAQLCNAKRVCEAESMTDSKCSARLEEVLKATCTCLDQTVKRAKGFIGNNPMASLNEGFIKGKVEEQFRQCHREAGVPYQEQKLENVKKVFKETIVNIVLQKDVPDALKNAMRLLLDVFKDFGREWSGILCSNCHQGQLDLDMEVKQLRTIVQENSG